MQQVVAREIMLQETNDLGIVVPDNEIADIIKDVQTRMQGGQFDLAFYRQRFLPHFKNRYGLDYEKFVKQDLRLESFQNLFDEVDKAPLLSPESELAQNDTWIFETIEIEPNKLVEEKIIENKDNAEAIAVEIINIPPKKWKRKLAELKLESQKTGAITISERGKLAGGKLPFDKLKAIFKLTKDNPVLDKPIKHEDRLYIVRLVEISKGKDKAEKPTGTDPFFRMWMSKLLAKAKVESYVGGEEQ